MQSDNICTCTTCHYQWQRGKSGEHSCLEKLRDDLYEILKSIPDCPVYDENRIKFAIAWIKQKSI